LVGWHAGYGRGLVFAFRRILDPKTAAEYASVLYPIKNALKVAKGELLWPNWRERARAQPLHHSTKIRRRICQALDAPHGLSRSETLVERLGNDWTKPGVMLSNGPYMLAEWRPTITSSSSAIRNSMTLRT
jgi:oligopeptide transport system substrate-binding protein